MKSAGKHRTIVKRSKRHSGNKKRGEKNGGGIHAKRGKTAAVINDGKHADSNSPPGKESGKSAFV